MRLAARPLLRRLAVIVMMAAVAAFTLQGTLIAASQAATGGGNYQHGVPHSHAHKDDAEHDEGAEHSESGEHSHTDGTIHRHAIDDDDVDVKEHGCACCWNMAVAIGVLPTVNFYSIAVIAGSKLAIEMASPHRGAEPDGLRRPPRPPSIA